MTNVLNRRNLLWTALAAGVALATIVLVSLDPSAATPRSDMGAPTLPELRGEEVAVLTQAPLVPPPIARDYATKVLVELESVELTKEISPGVDYTFWTFGGSVPGNFIRVRQGDEVEIRLTNDPTSLVPHNIDLHAVTGPGGGAVSTFTVPGQETSFKFRALNPGLYVYHCAVAPVGMHIGNGMYGLILVEPQGGLADVDREFYVMQGDFYTGGKAAPEGVRQFDYEQALTEIPDFVVFNGAVGSLTGDNALTAHQGERVRLFVGNGGPNLISSFHVIGEIFDNVYSEGGTLANNNVQTTLVPAGGAAIVEFRADVPGTYMLVDHSILRVDKGALGMLQVSGAATPIFTDGGAGGGGMH